MRKYGRLKKLFYICRATFFLPKYKNKGKSTPVIIYIRDGTVYENCHYDYIQKKWMCPWSEKIFEMDEVEYWKHPKTERIFSLTNEYEDSGD